MQYFECYSKNSGNVLGKYAAKILIELAFTIRQIVFLLTQLKIGVLRCKNAIPKRPPKDLYIYLYIALYVYIALFNH